MRNTKTLLVLGAGASHGFGLPLGSGLRTTIADDLNILFDDWGNRLEKGSSQIVEALRSLVQKDETGQRDINPHRHAAVQISGAMRLSSSIDEYIERHKDDVLKVECAKLAIAKAIIEAEKKSVIYSEPVGSADPLGKASDSWLALMLRDLTRGLTKSGLAGAFENVAIVNFNYDRCVEHYAYHWFQRLYGLTPTESAEVCARLRIYHPYGSIGPLPWQVGSGTLAYGADVGARELVEISKRIQTYSEATDAAKEPGFVGDFLDTAKRLVFLGFGFHQQNLDLLTSQTARRSTFRVYATTEGIPQPRLELIKNSLGRLAGVQVPDGLYFEPLTGSCEKFWNRYGDVVVQ